MKTTKDSKLPATYLEQLATLKAVVEEELKKEQETKKPVPQ